MAVGEKVTVKSQLPFTVRPVHVVDTANGPVITASGVAVVRLSARLVSVTPCAELGAYSRGVEGEFSRGDLEPVTVARQLNLIWPPWRVVIDKEGCGVVTLRRWSESQVHGAAGRGAERAKRAAGGHCKRSGVRAIQPDPIDRVRLITHVPEGDFQSLPSAASYLRLHERSIKWVNGGECTVTLANPGDGHFVSVPAA